MQQNDRLPVARFREVLVEFTMTSTVSLVISPFLRNTDTPLMSTANGQVSMQHVMRIKSLNEVYCLTCLQHQTNASSKTMAKDKLSHLLGQFLNLVSEMERGE